MMRSKLPSKSKAHWLRVHVATVMIEDEVSEDGTKPPMNDDFLSVLLILNSWSDTVL